MIFFVFFLFLYPLRTNIGFYPLYKKRFTGYIKQK